jgi:hypothetical protein
MSMFGQLVNPNRTQIGQNQTPTLPEIFRGPAEPVMSTEMVIEEAFIYVFCDLMYGGGWMEIEWDVRGEKRENEVTRNAVEFVM